MTEIEKNPGTINLYERTNCFMEDNLYPRLREIVSMPDADTEKIEDVVNYIDWAFINNMELTIDLTEEDRRLIRMADEASSYDDYAAGSDAYMLGTW